MSSNRPCARCTMEPNWYLQVNHWCPVLFTDDSRFNLSTCDRCKGAWRSPGAACNIVHPDQIGGRSVMVWGGISMEGPTDVYRQGNDTPDCH